jgi:peptidoglycan/LPS O-acetylase OafA/YrhL
MNSIPAPQASRIEALDGYRAVAAIGVLISHTAGEVWFIRSDEPGAHVMDNLGNFGVAVFFVLSGFLIFRPFVAASLDGKRLPATAPYLIRRGLRVFPAYWVALAAWALWAPAVDRAAGSTVGMLLLTDPYSSDYVWLTGLYVSWTLTIEVAFYVFVPLYAWCLHRVARRYELPVRRLRVHLGGIGLMYVSAFVYRSLTTDHWDGPPIGAVAWLPGYLDWFAFGMLMATLVSWGRAGHLLPAWLTGLAQRTIACWTLAAAAYFVIVVLKGDELLFTRVENAAQMSFRHFFQGVAAFFFVVPAVFGRTHQRGVDWFRTPSLLFLGTVSFGIYLWHPVVMLWFDGLSDGSSPRVRFAALTVVVLAVTIPIAAASYWLLERPMMRLYRSGPAPARVPTTSTGRGPRARSDV